MPWPFNPQLLTNYKDWLFYPQNRKKLKNIRGTNFLHGTMRLLTFVSTLTMLATTLMAFSVIPALIPINLIFAVNLSVIAAASIVFFMPIIALKSNLTKERITKERNLRNYVFTMPLIFGICAGIGAAIT